MSKKGFSTGYAWVYGLLMMFGIGVLYIVFSQVFSAHLVPVIKNMANSTVGVTIDNATQATINNGIDRYMAYFNSLPFILFFMIIIYMIVAAVRKEREDEYR